MCIPEVISRVRITILLLIVLGKKQPLAVTKFGRFEDDNDDHYVDIYQKQPPPPFLKILHGEYEM